MPLGEGEEVSEEMVGGGVLGDRERVRGGDLCMWGGEDIVDKCIVYMSTIHVVGIFCSCGSHDSLV